MPKVSSGLVMYRLQNRALQVFLAHPGGPFFQRKDIGAWSIPKGEVDAQEDLLDAARREFQEETGIPPEGPFLKLNPVKQKSGKVVHAWAFAGNCDPHTIVSNRFTLEWPPRSGIQREFPEIERAEFFEMAVAREKINPAQIAFLDQLAEIVRHDTTEND